MWHSTLLSNQPHPQMVIAMCRSSDSKPLTSGTSLDPHLNSSWKSFWCPGDLSYITLQDQSLHALQQVIDGVDVGECQLQVLDVCLDGSWVVLTQPLGSLPSGEAWNQLSHFLTLVRGRVSFSKCGGVALLVGTGPVFLWVIWSLSQGP